VAVIYLHKRALLLPCTCTPTGSLPPCCKSAQEATCTTCCSMTILTRSDNALGDAFTVGRLFFFTK